MTKHAAAVVYEVGGGFFASCCCGYKSRTYGTQTSALAAVTRHHTALVKTGKQTP